jgi:hypothetical protein
VNRPPTLFTRYLRAVAVQLATHPEWRPGQAYFNVLWRLDEYHEFTREAPTQLASGTDLDPFHRDDRVPVFLLVLCAHWTGRT